MEPKKQIAVTRVFNAPVKLVWQTWSDPELVKRWWGPDRFICPMARIDFREGGTSLVSMRYPKEMGGKDVYSIWNYKKIIPQTSIEFIQNLAHEDGSKADPTKLGMPPDFPTDIRTVVTFKDLGNDSTEMTVTGLPSFTAGSKTTFFAASITGPS